MKNIVLKLLTIVAVVLFVCVVVVVPLSVICLMVDLVTWLFSF